MEEDNDYYDYCEEEIKEEENDYYYYSAEQTEGEEEEENDCYSSSDHESQIAEGCDAVRDLTKPSLSKVITRESLLAAQREDMQRVMDLLSVREQQARTLLIHHRWNVDGLIEVYVEKGKSYLFGRAGVTETELVDLDLPQSSSRVMCYCSICMEDVQGKDATRMDCGHSFCNECWTGHFIVKIQDGQSKQIRCMAHKCNAICDETVIRKLVKLRQADLAEKFERFLLESYIEDNKMVKWCPSVPHCGSAIRVETDQILEVECSCGLQFCFGCATEAHSPCSCLMWQMWTKKCQDESETVNWITSNTKPCPKCQKAVEKNGGCNLVGCTCGQPFCWLCGAATGWSHNYQSIDGHTCGSYKKDIEDKAELAKHYLDRYIHYHDRYQGHTDSLKKEAELAETLKAKVAVLEEAGKNGGSKLIDFSWVKNGAYMLSRSRRALSYSYPFAFYMFGEELFDKGMTEKEREIKQNLFEDQQQQLEINVEKLSKVLEEPFEQFSEEKISEVRLQVINFSATTNNRCKKMYECIENDLLAPLMYSVHEIAPYQLTGAEKAEEFQR